MDLFAESGSAEVRAQQTSFVGVTQVPRASPMSSGPHLHKSPCRIRSDGNVTDAGNDLDTDFSVQVRIERTIIRDAQPLDEEIARERDLYTPSSSKLDWAGTHGSDV